MKFKNNPTKVNGWNRTYKESPYHIKDPETVCGPLDILFKKKGIRRILDLGCGDGRHLVHFAQLGYEMYGIDMSAWGILRSQHLLSNNNSLAHLIVGDIQYLPYAPESFDAVISFHVIHHNFLSDILKTVRNVNRILCKGGVFFTTLLKFQPASGRFNDADEVEQRTYLPKVGKEAGLPHHLFTEEEARSMFSPWRLLQFDASDKGNFHILAQKRL